MILASPLATRTANSVPLACPLGSLGLPIFGFIFLLTKCLTGAYILLTVCPVKRNAMANILKTEKKVAVISMLAEGSSIRAIERITGVNRNTIMSLGLRVGKACKRIMDERFRGLGCQQIQVDEIWGFIGAKHKNAARVGAYGDVWTFI